MQSLSPREAAEPSIPDAAGSGALRTTVYGVLLVLVLAGAWVRFNHQIAALAPALAAPVAGVANQLADQGRVKGLVEVGLLPLSATAEAVAQMGLPAGDAAALTEAVRRGRQRLVRLPLFDLSPTLPGDDGAGRGIEVSSGGYTRFILLTRQPLTITLPISRIGAVSFRNANAEMIDIGALTLTGPVRLPDLPAGQLMDVGVIAQ